jgi:hypothetical protein
MKTVEHCKKPVAHGISSLYIFFVPVFFDETTPASFRRSKCLESVDLSTCNKLNIAEKGCSLSLRNSMIIKRTGWAIDLMIFALNSASENVITDIFPSGHALFTLEGHESKQPPAL